MYMDRFLVLLLLLLIFIFTSLLLVNVAYMIGFFFFKLLEHTRLPAGEGAEGEGQGQETPQLSPMWLDFNPGIVT